MTEVNVTHAKVKFLQDNLVTIVTIDKIIDFKNAKPKNTKDFDKNVVYKCLWTDAKNPKEIEIPIQISDLAVIENDEDKQCFERKRGNFPKLSETIVNEFYDLDSSKEDDQEKLSNKKVVMKKKLLEKKNQVEKEILQEKIDKFITSNTLMKAGNSESEHAQNNDDHTSDIYSALQEQCNNEILQERFNKLMIAHNNLKEKYNNLKIENENLRFLNQNLQMKLFAREKKNDSEESQSKKAEIHDLTPMMSPILHKKLTNIPTTSSPKFSPTHSSPKYSPTHLSPIVCRGQSAINVKEGLTIETKSPAHFDDTDDNYLNSPPPKKQKTTASFNSGKSVKKLNLDLTFEDEENFDKNVNTKNKEKKFKNLKDKENTSKHDSKSSNNDKEKTDRQHNSAELQFLDKVYVTENDEKVCKVFLGEDTYIRYETWKEFMSLKTANRFTVAILKHLYTPEQLSRRSVSGSDAWRTPNGVHKRKQITPKKSRIITTCARYFLRKNYKLSKDHLKKELNLTTRYITLHISKVINGMKNPTKKPSQKKGGDDSSKADTDDDTSSNKNSDKELSDSD